MIPSPRDPGAVEVLASLLRGRRTVVLTGAGCSTESGIPDYRGAGVPRPAARSPVRYQEFIGSRPARVRYWARSAIGWGRVAEAHPNPGHHALAALERAGLVTGVITQNVDRLHGRAGSRRVVELHGSLARVRCLACDGSLPRSAVQRQLEFMNPGLRDADAPSAPDGDAELPEAATRGFRIPECRRCGGVLKPDVVFFGESVPADRVRAAWTLYEDAEVLLVAGSSLTVFSGYRFPLRATRERRPFGIVNLGPTRADTAAAVRVEAPVGTALPRLAELLGVALEAPPLNPPARP